MQPVSRMMSTRSSDVFVRESSVATKSGSKSAREICECIACGKARMASEQRRMEKSKSVDAEREGGDDGSGRGMKWFCDG